MTTLSDPPPVPPSAFTVQIAANPDHPDGEDHAAVARRIVADALAAAGYPAHPPRHLYAVPDLPPVVADYGTEDTPLIEETS